MFVVWCLTFRCLTFWCFDIWRLMFSCLMCWCLTFCRLMLWHLMFWCLLSSAGPLLACLFDFAGNLSHWPQLFLTENDSTKCLWTPRENRISRKNLVLEILSCLQIIFVSKFHFWMILSQILGFRPFSWVYFADFAYYDRQAWYLAGICGSVAEKNFLPKFRPF